ncbi:MAG TPA: HlyD family efflux transporter periplasmic adaptor subunit [Candidatus Methylomirabilis sp.]
MTDPAPHQPQGVEAPPPFLGYDPPHWVARGLAAVLLALFAAGVIASLVVQVPETVTSPFVLVPARGTDPVRAPRNGVVAAVQVGEGRSVRGGEPVFLIRSPAVSDMSSEARGLETQLAGAEESRNNARQKYDSQHRGDEEESTRLARRGAHLAQKLEEHRRVRAVREAKYRADLTIAGNEIEVTRKEIEFKKAARDLAQEIAERFEGEYKEGGISWIEANTRRLEATKLAVEVQQLERTLETVRLRVNQIQADHQTQEIEWRQTAADLENEGREVRTTSEKLRHTMASRQTEFREQDRRLAEDTAKARIRVTALHDVLGQNRGGDLAAAAPCDGTVIRLAVKAPGAVVQEGDLLCEVACAGGALQAELTVPPSGVSRLRPGQGVKLLYDAFPYQRHGVRLGTLRWVSPAGTTAGATSAAPATGPPVFRAVAAIANESIVVDGRPRPLMAGMGGRAEVVVGRRRLVAYAFEPLRQLKESLADAPAAPAGPPPPQGEPRVPSPPGGDPPHPSPPRGTSANPSPPGGEGKDEGGSRPGAGR